MADSPVLPPRPEPPRRIGDAAGAWLAWFGPGRLLMSAASVLVVAVGVFWLVRTPAPPTEAGLPFTTGRSTSSSVGSAVVATITAPSTSTPRAMLVHVAGAVVRPGVYRLDGDARVDAAIAAAGGPTRDAELDGLNLAAALVDGQRVYLPVVGEVDPASVPSSGTPSAPGGVDPPIGPIDLNVATATQLESLPGIGPATAAAIVDDREQHGPFASVSDLERVPGIGPAKLAAVADLVTV